MSSISISFQFEYIEEKINPEGLSKTSPIAIVTPGRKSIPPIYNQLKFLMPDNAVRVI